jgi:transposase-like protein
MKKPTPSYQRHRFPSEIIGHAVWLYHRYLEVDIFGGLRLKI